jgi:hypothetical protein
LPQDGLDELESEEIPAHIQAARVEQMMREAAKLQQLKEGHGSYA